MTKAERFITFVFIGESLPSYARRSLRLAAVHSGLRVRIIGNAQANFQRRSKLFEFVALEDFYDASPISEASRYVTLDTDFRSGFWVKSLERFFVLEQFMRRSGERNLLHAELDQLLFRTDNLLDQLEKISHGELAFPIHGPRKAVASLFFAGNTDSLASLVEFATSGEFYSNEMVLLWRWSRRYQNRFIRLPTIADVLRTPGNGPKELPESIDAEDLGGVVDAAELGLWVGGRDPRNLPLNEKPTNHYTYPRGKAAVERETLNDIRLQLDFESSQLKAKSPLIAKPVNVFNLHLHSKTHVWVSRSAQNMVSLIDMANLDERNVIPGTRAVQLANAVTSRLGAWKEIPESLLRRALLTFGNTVLDSSYILTPRIIRIMCDFSWSPRMSGALPSFPRGSSVLLQAREMTACLQSIATNGLQALKLVIEGPVSNYDRKELHKFLYESSSVAFIEDVSPDDSSLFFPLPKGVQSLDHSVAPLSIFLRRFLNLKWRKKPRISWGFEFELNFAERSHWAKSLMLSGVAERTRGFSVRHRHQAYSSHCFSACPPGSSIDTHEMWEAMYLGCVPIVEESEHARRLIALGLPIWMISSPSQLSEVGEEDLVAKYAEMKPLFLSEFLSSKAWRNLLKSSSEIRGPIQAI